ncbi:glycosyltransferase family 4 protein [Marinicrinis sediminis]|uniref:Glycosyltransferase family 4 protein n=1 Tax=Marinicrinis sediminis TaxID=1652465 RepID=A0ABW5RAN0_9BACL
MNVLLYVLGFAAAFAVSLILTPFVKRFAVWVGAVDAPNHRKVHTRIMPRLGGVAIYLAFAASFLMMIPALDGYKANAAWAVLLGGFIIVVVGALDDKMELSPKVKLLGQLAAALIVVFGFDLKVDFVNIPFASSQNLGEWLSIPLTIFWIVGVTNAINLIDGLDGLAAGVSAIATATTLVMAVMMGNVTVIVLCALLLGSILGFLLFNFHPAKIFMGDSGSLFLGFSLATLSILGFKQATLVSFVVPLLVLGVPLSDTFFAIIRRILNRTPISVADKSHLHHCLLQLGFSHRSTVLLIYGIAIFFGLSAIVLSQLALWISLIALPILILALHIGAEAIGIFSKTRKPILNLLRKAGIKTSQFIGTRLMK